MLVHLKVMFISWQRGLMRTQYNTESMASIVELRKYQSFRMIHTQRNDSGN